MLTSAVKSRPETESEQALVAACVDGDQAAWRRFYARFQPGIVRSAERSLRRLGVADPATLANDVAGEVLADLLAKDCAALARFEGRSSIATWLRVLTRRRASRSLRKRRPGALEEPARIEDAGPSPSDVALTSERRSIVREHLGAMAPRDRLALQLFYEGGRSYREVADALDLPIERIGTLLGRARRRLGEALDGQID